jgi:hypothetical protein
MINKINKERRRSMNAIKLKCAKIIMLPEKFRGGGRGEHIDVGLSGRTSFIPSIILVKKKKEIL